VIYGSPASGDRGNVLLTRHRGEMYSLYVKASPDTVTAPKTLLSASWRGLTEALVIADKAKGCLVHETKGCSIFLLSILF
jgi:hypothetical protein